MGKLAAIKKADDKKADIEKEIEAPADKLTEEQIRKIHRGEMMSRLEETEPQLPAKLLDNLAKRFPLNEILSSLTAAGLVLRPREFQRIIIVKVDGSPSRAVELDAAQRMFPWREVDFSDVPMYDYPFEINPKIIARIAPFMEDRSYLEPILCRRVVRITLQPVKLAYSVGESLTHPSFPPLLLITLLYALYRARFGPATIDTNNSLSRVVERAIRKSPVTTIPALALAGATAIGALERAAGNRRPELGPYMSKQSAIEFLPHILGPYALLHIGSAYMDALKRQQQAYYGESSVPDILTQPNKLFGIYFAGRLGAEFGLGTKLREMLTKLKPTKLLAKPSINVGREGIGI